jgi:hypothetical protein
MKEEDEGRRDVGDRAEHALIGEDRAEDDGFHRKPSEPEHAIQMLAPIGRIGQRQNDQNGDNDAGRPARQLNCADDDDDGIDPFLRRQRHAARIDRILRGDQQQRCHRHDDAEGKVKGEHRLARAFRSSADHWVAHRRQHGETGKMDAGQPEGRHGANEIGVEVEDRDGQRQTGKHQANEPRIELAGFIFDVVFVYLDARFVSGRIRHSASFHKASWPGSTRPSSSVLQPCAVMHLFEDGWPG